MAKEHNDFAADDTPTNEIAASHTRRTMPYYIDPRANREIRDVNTQRPAAPEQPKVEPVQIQPIQNETTQPDVPDAHDKGASAIPLEIGVELPSAAPEQEKWTPKLRTVSAEDALQIISDQLSQFFPHPDGTYVRDYQIFTTEYNRSTKLFLDAGMNMDAIAFRANIEGDTGTKVPGLDKCTTLGDVMKINLRGKPATVTLTKEQFEQLDGFYRSIVANPKKDPAATQGESVSR